MSAINEQVAREYFEHLGYLVSQPRKYTIPGRTKQAEEEADLVVFNPRVREHRLPEGVVWSTADLKTVARAVVAVRGWHTERFSVTTFAQAPDILRFAEPASVKFATRILGDASLAKVLCIPRLPASGELRSKTLEALRAKGVDGVISFSTMLAELIGAVDTRCNYERSDVLQVIRLLKNYDFVRDAQLELFPRRHARKGKAAAAAAPPPAGPDAP